MTDAYLYSDISSEPHTLATDPSRPADVATVSGATMSVHVAFSFVLRRNPRRGLHVTTTRYFFTLSTADEREIVAYHWHPQNQSVTYPHLHIGSARGAGDVATRAHYPTGRVTLEMFVRMLINEFNVEPLEPDWVKILAATERKHERRRSWPPPVSW